MTMVLVAEHHCRWPLTAVVVMEGYYLFRCVTRLECLGSRFRSQVRHGSALDPRALVRLDSGLFSGLGSVNTSQQQSIVVNSVNTSSVNS
ncbi:hypothetical protein Hdeb2414_s0024g00646661 [Helianthus debilis subsp. tardiflorus]